MLCVFGEDAEVDEVGELALEMVSGVLGGGVLEGGIAPRFAEEGGCVGFFFGREGWVCELDVGEGG